MHHNSIYSLAEGMACTADANNDDQVRNAYYTINVAVWLLTLNQAWMKILGTDAATVWKDNLLLAEGKIEAPTVAADQLIENAHTIQSDKETKQLNTLIEQLKQITQADGNILSGTYGAITPVLDRLSQIVTLMSSLNHATS